MYLWHIWTIGKDNDIFVFSDSLDNALYLSRLQDKSVNTAQVVDTKNINYVSLFGTCIVDVQKHKVIAEKIIKAITEKYPNLSRLPLRYFYDNYNRLQDIEKLFVYCIPVAYS